jgi:hypothetical protein
MARLGQYRHWLHRRSARERFSTRQRADEDNLGTLLIQQVSAFDAIAPPGKGDVYDSRVV